MPITPGAPVYMIVTLKGNEVHVTEMKMDKLIPSFKVASWTSKSNPVVFVLSGRVPFKIM